MYYLQLRSHTAGKCASKTGLPPAIARADKRVMSVISSIIVGYQGISPRNADRSRAVKYASIEAAQNWDVSERHLIVVSQVVPRVKHVISRRGTG